MRALNSSSGRKRDRSIPRNIWLTRIACPRMRMPPSSVLIAPPLNTAQRISAIMASPLPLYPPSGEMSPLSAVSTLVVGTPSESIAQPGGIVSWPLIMAL